MLCFPYVYIISEFKQPIFPEHRQFELPVPTRRGARLKADFQANLQKMHLPNHYPVMCAIKDRNYNRRFTLTAQESSSRSRSIHGRLSIDAALAPDPDSSFSPTMTSLSSSSLASFNSDLASTDFPNQRQIENANQKNSRETRLIIINKSKEQTRRSVRLVVVIER